MSSYIPHQQKMTQINSENFYICMYGQDRSVALEDAAKEMNISTQLFLGGLWNLQLFIIKIYDFYVETYNSQQDLSTWITQIKFFIKNNPNFLVSFLQETNYNYLYTFYIHLLENETNILTFLATVETDELQRPEIAHAKLLLTTIGQLKRIDFATELASLLQNNQAQ